MKGLNHEITYVLRLLDTPVISRPRCCWMINHVNKVFPSRLFGIWSGTARRLVSATRSFGSRSDINHELQNGASRGAMCIVGGSMANFWSFPLQYDACAGSWHIVKRRIQACSPPSEEGIAGVGTTTAGKLYISNSVCSDDNNKCISWIAEPFCNVVRFIVPAQFYQTKLWRPSRSSEMQLAPGNYCYCPSQDRSKQSRGQILELNHKTSWSAERKILLPRRGSTCIWDESPAT